MFEGYSSFAGTGETTAALDKPVLNAPIASPIRGQQVFIVTVMDDNYNPIAGADVYAPCTGQKPMLTNAQGVAQFTLTGQCNCEGAMAAITTPGGCNEQIELKCNSENPAYCAK